MKLGISCSCRDGRRGGCRHRRSSSTERKKKTSSEQKQQMPAEKEEMKGEEEKGQPDRVPHSRSVFSLSTVTQEIMARVKSETINPSFLYFFSFIDFFYPIFSSSLIFLSFTLIFFLVPSFQFLLLSNYSFLLFHLPNFSLPTTIFFPFSSIF